MSSATPRSTARGSLGADKSHALYVIHIILYQCSPRNESRFTFHLMTRPAELIRPYRLGAVALASHTRAALGGHDGGPGMKVIENKHSIDVESTRSVSIHPAGETCPDLVPVLLSIDPHARTSARQCIAWR